MPRRPLLTNYPHLHGVLRKDPLANRDFQTCLSDLKHPPPSTDPVITPAMLDAVNLRLREAQEALSKQDRVNVKTVRFIRLLGEVIESQTKLQPYSQDASAREQYKIMFSPEQIRMVLRLYWDVIADDMERKLVRVDPAADREGANNADDDDQ